MSADLLPVELMHEAAHIRLSFAYYDEGDIREGIARLKGAVRLGACAAVDTGPTGAPRTHSLEVASSTICGRGDVETLFEAARSE